MSVATGKVLDLGYYFTAQGLQAVVDAVVDGMLIGRINLNENLGEHPIWHAYMWQLDGTCRYGANKKDSLRTERAQKIKKTYWVNIYPSGPGQLRKDWEEALVESSRCEEPCLCRVEVKVDAVVGDGLK